MKPTLPAVGLFLNPSLNLLFFCFRNEIFRLNLELGRFHEPLYSQSESLTCCQFNDQHQLFVCGTTDGKVEAWDYRDRSRAAVLDCVLNKAIAMELDLDSRFSHK